MATTFAVFSCPSDTKPPTVANNGGNPNGTKVIATSSYMGSMGAFDGSPCNVSGTNVKTPARNNGLLTVNQCRDFGDVTDGTSNAFAVGEVCWQPIQTIAGTKHGSVRQFVLGNITTAGGPNCSRKGVTQNGSFLHLRSTRHKLNGPLVGGTVHRAFHSEHTGGAQFLMGDGSVRFVSENINHSGSNVNQGLPYGLYQRLAGINDGQVVSSF